MNPLIGWTLAAVALVAGYASYGWPGVLLAFSVIVFWLLLQFSRALRTLKNAGAAPVGHVGSAVMLHSRLRAGMSMMQVVGLTRSLGRKLADNPETWAWADDSGAQVTLRMTAAGKLAHWDLERPAAPL